jgi:hypothetical protein
MTESIPLRAISRDAADRPSLRGGATGAGRRFPATARTAAAGVSPAEALHP